MELIGEDINDNAQMQVLALSTLAREAEHALTGPVPTERPVYFDTEFDAAKGLPPGLSRLADPDAPAATVTGDAPSLTLPPGLTRQAARDDSQRLAALLPTFSLLYQNLGANLMWAYVALDNGLMRPWPTVLLCLLLLPGSVLAASRQYGQVRAVVVRVCDGDTVVVDIPEYPDVVGKDIRVRLAGVNAPELRDPDPGLRQAAWAAREAMAAAPDPRCSDK